MKLTREQYKELNKKLPLEIVSCANSEETTHALYTLAEKHHLHIDEAGILYDIVIDTMLGVISTKNMEREVAEQLKLSPLDATSIVRDVDEQVFAPIKKLMVDLYKNSNPFLPQTLKHIDEHEEETELDRDHLLAQIENPDKPQIRKESASTNLPTQTLPIEILLDPTPEPVDTTPPIDEELKKRRERMLGAITGEKLSGVVTMHKFIEETSAKQIEVKPQESSFQVTPSPVQVPVVTEVKAVDPSTATLSEAVAALGVAASVPEVKTMDAIAPVEQPAKIETTSVPTPRALSEIKTIEMVVPVPKPPTLEVTSQTTTSPMPLVPTPPVAKARATDPYREPIE